MAWHGRMGVPNVSDLIGPDEGEAMAAPDLEGIGGAGDRFGDLIMKWLNTHEGTKGDLSDFLANEGESLAGISLSDAKLKELCSACAQKAEAKAEAPAEKAEEKAEAPAEEKK